MANNLKQVPSWSFSSLTKYETCNHWAWHTFINRSPKLPYQENRGTALHSKIEGFFLSIDDLPQEIHPASAAKIASIREHFCRGPTWNIEEPWGYDRNWEPTEYKTAWHKAKLDLYIRSEDVPTVYIHDWKSGKREGNEIKHVMQGQLYAIDAVRRFPDTKNVTATFHYIDEGTAKENNYPRAIIESWIPKWRARAEKMTNALIFPAKPSKSNCKFCDFGPNGSAACEYGTD